MQVSKMKKEDFFVWFLLKFFYLDMLLYKKLENTISFIAWHTVIDILFLAIIYRQSPIFSLVTNKAILANFMQILIFISYKPL